MEATARMRYGIELETFTALMADSGCGKSLALGVLADELRRSDWTVHYFSHSTVGPFDLINVLARKVGLLPKRSRGETASLLIDHLIEDPKRNLLVVDEAHELGHSTLEDLRLLTIADFDRNPPFLLLLSGQPRLDDILADPRHHALDQRITTIARIAPMSAEETREYLELRLAAAGVKKRHPVFETDAMEAIAELTHGVPRRVNALATSALIGAASRSRRLVTAQDVQDARLDRGRV